MMLKYVDPNILKITNAFMYTEYPHKSFWSTSLKDKDYRSALLGLLTREPKTPLLLYIHILYCTQLCWFCTCHLGEITKNYGKREKYLDLLYSGINRISMGIQDFDPQVQKAINRVQPVKLVEDLMDSGVSELFPME